MRRNAAILKTVIVFTGLAALPAHAMRWGRIARLATTIPSLAKGPLAQTARNKVVSLHPSDASCNPETLHKEQIPHQKIEDMFTTICSCSIRFDQYKRMKPKSSDVEIKTTAAVIAQEWTTTAKTLLNEVSINADHLLAFTQLQDRLIKEITDELSMKKDDAGACSPLFSALKDHYRTTQKQDSP